MTYLWTHAARTHLDLPSATRGPEHPPLVQNITLPGPVLQILKGKVCLTPLGGGKSRRGPNGEAQTVTSLEFGLATSARFGGGGPIRTNLVWVLERVECSCSALLGGNLATL